MLALPHDLQWVVPTLGVAGLALSLPPSQSISHFPWLAHHLPFSRPPTSNLPRLTLRPSFLPFAALVRFPIPDDNAFPGQDLDRSGQSPSFVRRAPSRPTFDPTLEEDLRASPSDLQCRCNIEIARTRPTAI
ncbi:hypothetical protein F4678DRAFT_329043 [Xylaria arbuscula]|nr:hypothetical protein F4678DRAFT_329043 [Xylaria arbuscula]